MALDHNLEHSTGAARDSEESASRLERRLFTTRNLSLELAAPLSDEDLVVQASDDASPAKWHLAHTTWFFERFVLQPHDKTYLVFDQAFEYCFNSYYEAVGPRHPRPKRGLLTRPSSQQVRDYRAHVDQALGETFADGRPPQPALDAIELGIHHEQQHQELLLTDILALFAAQPLKPAYLEGNPGVAAAKPAQLQWIGFDGGVFEVGHAGNGFAYDNEGPRHEVLLQPFKLADRCVTNAEWIEFIEDKGYETASLWLADGWSTIQQQEWKGPLYWEEVEGGHAQMTLKGFRPVRLDAPVTHLSYYEADAFARWAGKRLPTEFEWEVAAEGIDIRGRTLGAKHLAPMPADAGPGLKQMYGDVWEWTQSSYAPYPGYKPPQGAIGEYNGKFMCSQYVLRGGSCATPERHIRRTYRNFFYPHQRWQFTGLRLAEHA